MKKTIIILFLLSVHSASVYSADVSTNKVCETLSHFAKTAMEGRQRGVTKEEMLNVLINEGTPVERFLKKHGSAIIEDVFKQPQQIHEELITPTAEWYALQYYYLCTKD